MTNSIHKILIVEDESDIREIIAAALEHLGGYTVESCSSGQDALNKAPTFKPDIVLLDVMMPNMDGPSTLKELRKFDELKDTVTIFITAKAMPAEIEYYISLGAIGVITKPFDPVTICADIEKLWDTSNKSNKG